MCFSAKRRLYIYYEALDQSFSYNLVWSIINYAMYEYSSVELGVRSM